MTIQEDSSCFGGAQGASAPPRVLPPSEPWSIDGLGQAAIVTDLQGIVTGWNEAARALYGWTAAEAVGKDVLDVTGVVAPRERASAVAARIRRGEPWSGDVVVRPRGGGTRVVHVACAPRIDEHGRPFGVLCLSHALVGARAENERQRLEERQMFQKLFGIGTALATELDEQKLLQLITDEAKALTGAEFGAFFFNRKDEQGHSFMLHTTSGVCRASLARLRMPRITPLFAPTFQGEGVVRLDDVRDDPRYGGWGPQPSGHPPVVSYLAVPVVTRAGEVLGGLLLSHRERARFTEAHEHVVTGIAGQAAVALENARLYARLRESEASANEACERARDADRRKDEFLAMLGHELRNPLAPIMTAQHLLRLRGQKGRELDVIERQVKHLVRLVDDLLDVSRITRGRVQLRRERLDVAEVVAKAIEMASPLIEERSHRLCVDVPSEGLACSGDMTRLSQVVSNLLTNAAKYTQRGGHIEVLARRDAGGVSVAVRDDGMGIAADVLPTIFDAFIQGPRALDRAQGGLGLGLALVKSLTELHGGTVEVRSAGVGHGSEFTIRLPACGDPAGVMAPDGPLRSESSTPVPPRARVLVVDDNHDAAETLSEALRSAGHDVRTAFDGPTALAVAASFGPDLALLDIGLPVMDGYELARRLRESDPALCLFAVTGYGQPEDRARVAQAGFDAHFVKPVDFVELIGAVRRAHDPAPGTSGGETRAGAARQSP